MNICVLNGSPRGAYSTTLHTALYLQKRYPCHNFEIIHVGTKIRALEQDMTAATDAMARADLILFAYPVYTFIAPSQLHRFIAALKACGVDMTGKFAAQITTSRNTRSRPDVWGVSTAPGTASAFIRTTLTHS